jgi:hypothetical protein
MYMLVTMQESDYESFMDTVMLACGDVLARGILNDAALPQARDDAAAELDTRGLRGERLLLAENIISAVLAPNMSRDLRLEDTLREAAANAVETVYVQQGQRIVDEGEIISHEMYSLLEYFGYVNGGLRVIMLYAGLVVLSVLLTLVMTAYVWFYHRQLTRNKKEMALLLIIYVLTLALCRAMSPLLAYYFMPVLLFAVLTALLLEVKLSVVLTIITTLVCSLVYGAGYDFLAYFLIMGLIICTFAKHTAERNQVFRISLLFAAVSAVTAAALHLIGRGALIDLPLLMISAVGVPVVIVIFAVGSLPFWEAAFGITTPMKLLELISPDKPLIRKLAAETPGTYHHSLIVANLAETAALEVGADHVLARVGGFYHDIGKLRYPGYFSENITGANPHDELEPLASAEIIFEHVENGLKLAAQNKIPQVICDFIEQHHGNTTVAYFYNKAKSANPEAEVDEILYRYPHSPPTSKEIAIVMLADTCEAAVRSVAPGGKDYAETKKFVNMLIKKKLEENQLSESGLSIRDLDVIAEAFMGVFKGMYHDRVKYEKKEEVKKTDEVKKPTEIKTEEIKKVDDKKDTDDSGKDGESAAAPFRHSVVKHEADGVKDETAPGEQDGE